MSKMFLDQAWVGTFGVRAEASYCLRTAEWAVQLPPSLLEVVLALPPYCVVRRKVPTGAILTAEMWDQQMPPLSCGIVQRYAPQHVFVLTHPDSTEGVWVPTSDLEIVKPYACLSRDYLMAIRHVHLQGGLVPKPLDFVRGRIRDHFKRGA